MLAEGRERESEGAGGAVPDRCGEEQGGGGGTGGETEGGQGTVSGQESGDGEDTETTADQSETTNVKQAKKKNSISEP